MKPQDILFFVALAVLLWKKNPKYFVIAGLLCFIFAMPLFYLWVFFTAERLIWYAAALFLIAILLFARKSK